MEQSTPNLRALEAYLRFSYPLGYAPFPGQENVPYPEIRFTSVPGRAKEDYLKELSRILEDIFETERQYSDAAFLSSGVDSSLIAFGIRARKTFSVAYEEQAFDESALAMHSAEKLGSEHHIVKISPADYFDAVEIFEKKNISSCWGRFLYRTVYSGERGITPYGRNLFRRRAGRTLLRLPVLQQILR